MKFKSEIKHFHSRKCTWKCRLRRGVHFISWCLASSHRRLWISGKKNPIRNHYHWKKSAFVISDGSISYFPSYVVRDEYVIITLKRCFDVIITYSLRTMYAGFVYVWGPPFERFVPKQWQDELDCVSRQTMHFVTEIWGKFRFPYVYHCIRPQPIRKHSTLLTSVLCGCDLHCVYCLPYLISLDIT